MKKKLEAKKLDCWRLREVLRGILEPDADHGTRMEKLNSDEVCNETEFETTKLEGGKCI
jgi:hypothetical protein